MKKKMLSVALIAAMITTMVAGCGSKADSESENSSSTESSTSSSEDTIVIGGVFNTTGYMASYEEPSLNGFNLAVKEINEAGGINGMQIEAEVINAQSDASQNASAVNKLVDVNGASVLCGICETNLAISAGTQAQDYQVPFITVGATLPDLPERVGDYFYLAPFGDNIQAYASAEYAYNQLGARTAYVIEDSTSEYTLALSKYFQERFEKLGGEIVLTDSYDENGYTDYSANVEKVLALDEAPDMLFFASFTDQAPTMLTQYRARGLDMPIFSGDGFDSITIPDIAGEDANNVYFTTHVNYAAESDLVDNFKTAYKAEYGSEVESAFAALGYDTVYLIKYAIETYGNGDTSPAGIKAALDKVDGFEGVTGAISYTDGHVPAKTVFLDEFVDGEIVPIDAFVPESE